jgi:hypothetical protein
MEVAVTMRTPELMPTLSAGRHRNARRGACFMEFASYLAGERFSDHPRCTHPLLAALARDVNDLTRDESRNRLMPLVNRVIGLTASGPLSESASAAIAVRSAAAALPIASVARQRALAAGLISVIESLESPSLATLAREALDGVPQARDWARSYLNSARVAPMRLTAHRAEALVHTAAVGIALACVTDADSRLAALLEQCIVALEQLTATAPAAVGAVVAEPAAVGAAATEPAPV